MTTQIIVITAAVLIVGIALNIGTGYYWKPRFQTLSKLLSTKVEFFFPLLPLFMKIRGRYKNREVRCHYNALFTASSSTIRISMKPLRKLNDEPTFMLSYKRPTPNTARQGNEIVYVINTGTFKLKEYTEAAFIAILDELTEATEKMEQSRS